jgi:ATP-binding cassette, subfamily B, bacterial MsbA
VEPWIRLARMLWPYRQQAVLSLVFGVLAAALWAVELLLTFPLVTVFVEDQTLHHYVTQELGATRQRLAEAEQEVQQLDARLALLQPRNDEAANEKRIRILKERARQQKKLNAESRHVWFLSAMEPWVRALPTNPFQLVLLLLLALAVTTLLKGLCTIAQDIWAGKIAERVVIDLRQGLFRRILKWDPQTVSQQGSAQLLAALTYDLQGLAHGLTTVGGRIVREPLKAAACIAAAFAVNWQLTSLSLLFVPLAGWMFATFGNRMKRAVRRVLDTMARMYRFLEESFSNARLVMAFGLEGEQRRSFHRHNKEFSRHSLKLVKIDALTNPSTELLGMLAVVAGVLPAAYLVLRETTSIAGIRLADAPLDVPELTTFYALLAGVLDPLRRFSKYFTTIKQCSSILERTLSRWDQPSAIVDPPQAVIAPRLQSSLEFRGVHFRYRSAANPSTPDRVSVLNDVSLTVKAGETIAIVGANGCGKSTLLGLLPRFYDPVAGQILVDGVDLAEIRLRDWRSQVAVVGQEPLLLDDTIFENIRYGQPKASRSDVIAAAQLAHVLEFSERLPEGLDTRVGEYGRELSGGQRQRIALARAMLRNPSLLLLDEPTAAVDAISEQLIHKALSQFLQGRTTILISHHLGPAWLELIDRLVVMDHGQVIGVGRHEQLLSTCPPYARLMEVRRQPEVTEPAAGSSSRTTHTSRAPASAPPSASDRTPPSPSRSPTESFESMGGASPVRRVA